ncbi:MAG: hypothetical protein RLZZ595_1585 [Bacteroidota bacterium]|jgi:hypothetical protein
MKLLSPAISTLARLRSWRIDAWMQHPISAQREVLQDLVTAGQYTEFGRKYEFSKLFNTKTFKQAVPIHEYDHLKPYVERIMAGEQNILWNTPINWFAKSSGTTSDKSKFIPVSQESLVDGHYKAAKDILSLYYMHHPESDLLTGKGLVIGGSHTVSSLHEEAFFGDLSAVLMQNTPFWGNWIRTPELKIALMDEWENKIEMLATTTMQENVTSVSGVPTWTLVLFQRILELTGKQNMKEVWPSLELYMHGGVSFHPYKEQFKKLIGEDIQYLEMYNASEGFFAAQDMSNNEGMLLFLDHGIFYEFMPMEEYGKEDPQTIGLKDVELGKLYAPVISTNGGLWRYMIGDTISFTSLQPYRIKVSGRVKLFINAFGEELIIENAEKAMAEACKETEAIVTDYTAGPVYFSDNGNGAHEWLVEFEKAPSDMQKFTSILDEALKKQNSDYEAKRYKGIALREPIVKALPNGHFNKWLKHKNKLGGQHKVPRLSNDRIILEEILRLL